MKLWEGGVIYIINGVVTSNKLDNRTNISYLMEHSDTTGVILYWKIDQINFIHI